MAKTDREKLETFERMDMPLLANIYRKRVNKGSSSGSGSPKERKGGLGSNKGAARYKRTSAEERKRINSDGRFGYFDEVNKRYIPAFIDFMDGGGFDTRGDTFEGGGPLSGIANDLGIKPYGSQRDRMFGGPDTSIPRPRVRPTQTMPDELTGVPFNNTPPTMPDELTGVPFNNTSPIMSDEVSGVPFNNTPPTMPDEVSGVPFNNTPNPFTGPTYDMVMDQSFGNMSGRNAPRRTRNYLNSDPKFARFMELVESNSLMPKRSMEENYQIYLQMQESGSLDKFM
tara:strand:+ start:3192 stop:4043 length:852 start_codon:yes stop_codon:yes gene_type:complete